VLDALLIGHDERVYSVRWHPKIHNFQVSFHSKFNCRADDVLQPARLLSSSLDKTMVMWRPDAESGVWIEDMRVGEVRNCTADVLRSLIAFNRLVATIRLRFMERCSTVMAHFYSVMDIRYA
jgi:hypothetical protein